jgi:outer membrane immunogenic protein
MRISTRGSVLLASICLLAAATALGQQSKGPGEPPPVSADLSLTYSVERSQVAPGNCGCFWFQGAGADAAVTLWKGVGIAGAVTGEHANQASGMNIDKVAYVIGPRYTFAVQTHHAGLPPHMQLFGEVLLGGVHGFNSIFPAATGLNPSATSFALQTGGGINTFISKRFALRVIEVEYLRTDLPNNYSNMQNDLRLGFGVTYHLSSISKRR